MVDTVGCVGGLRRLSLRHADGRLSFQLPIIPFTSNLRFSEGNSIGVTPIEGFKIPDLFSHILAKEEKGAIRKRITPYYDRLPSMAQTGLLQHLGRRTEREAGLFEGVDDFFDACLLVVEGHNGDMGELVDLRFINLCDVCEGPTDPVPGEGSLTVGQKELDHPLLCHGGRSADQDGEHDGSQHHKARS